MPLSHSAFFVCLLIIAYLSMSSQQEYNDLNMLLNNHIICTNPEYNKVKQRNDNYGNDYPEHRPWSMKSEIISYFNTNNNANKELNLQKCEDITSMQLALNELPSVKQCFIPWISSTKRCDILSMYRYMHIQALSIRSYLLTLYFNTYLCAL